MFDSQGNAWIVDNFMVGAQNQDDFWSGRPLEVRARWHAALACRHRLYRRRPLGPGFGLAIDAHGNVWTTSFGGNNTISLFDSTGKPLSPPEGYDFGGKLSKMQGVIATPNGDIWAADTMNSQIVRFPKGDPSKGEILCHNAEWRPAGEPLQALFPFALAVDQKDNIWVTNFLADHVTRFPGGDVGKAETFRTGFSGSGLAVDSLGNVWITNKFGNSERGRLKIWRWRSRGKSITTAIPTRPPG